MTKLKSATDLDRKVDLIGLYEDLSSSVPSIEDKLETVVAAVSKNLDRANASAKGIVRSAVEAIRKEVEDVRGVLAVTMACDEGCDGVVTLNKNYGIGSKYSATLRFRVLIFLTYDVDIRELAYRLRKEALGPSFSGSWINRIDNEYLGDINPWGLSIKIPDNAAKYLTLNFNQSSSL